MKEFYFFLLTFTTRFGAVACITAIFLPPEFVNPRKEQS